MLSYDDFLAVLSGQRLPALIVDLDALDRNVDRHVALLQGHRLTLRPATKSVRAQALLKRILDRAGATFSGLMCYCPKEAVRLARAGFDDLLVAYPTLQPDLLSDLAKCIAKGTTIRVAIDSNEGAAALALAGQREGVTMKACLCVDMSVTFGRLFLGVRRSPLHTAAQVLAMAQSARALGLEVDGLLAYEAIVAGLPDNVAGSLTNGIKRAIKRRAMPELIERRAQMVNVLTHDGFSLRVVNGGGTGSLSESVRDASLTEVTAGSGFFKPHLFDAYRSTFVRSLEPACFFALEITRRPAAAFVTCYGGGFVASGSQDPAKSPLPWLPEGLSLLTHEMAGEVQTPLRVLSKRELTMGSPILFRHAKAGEVCEHFEEALLVQSGRLVERVPTYRGQR